MASKPPSKRSLTLDLASGASSSSTSAAGTLAPPTKRARVAAASSVAGPSTGASSTVPVLTTPDVQMLKLSSPEMAKFLTSTNGLATPTPSGYVFPKTVTEEQELYAKGFEDALKKMQQNKDQHQTAISTIEKATAAHRQGKAGAQTVPAEQPQASERPVSRPSSSNSGSIDSSEGSSAYMLPEGVRVKEEADDSSVVSTEENQRLNSSLSPIDMESQERIKLERKRLRNRVAASKCRKRKLEKISLLDEKVQQLKGENSELANVVKKLKASVCDLKQEVMEHMNNGCQIVLSDTAGF